MTDPSPRDVPGAVQYVYRGTLIVGAVLPFVPSMLGQLPSTVLTAASLLLIAAGCLMLSYTRGRDAMAGAFGAAALAAAPAILILAIKLFPAMVMLVVAPLTWVTSVWSGRPEGLGLAPPWSTYPIEVVFSAQQPVAVAIAAVAAGVAALAQRRELSPALKAVSLVLPVALPLTLVVADAQWPTVSLATLAIGIGLTAAATVASEPTWRRVAAGTQGVSFVAAGAAGCLPTRPTTILALTLVTTAAAWIGWRQRPAVRVVAWIFGVGFGAMAGAAAALATGYSRVHAAFAVLVVALAALALSAAVRANRRDESLALAGSAHGAMVVAVMLTAGSLASATVLCGIWTAALTARIWWPGVPTVDRRFLAVPAAAWATMTWWLVLGPPADVYSELYTLPIAGVAFLLGWAIRGRQPLTRTWAAYGPAAALAVLPTATIAADTADQRRWLVVAALVGVGAVVMFWRRRGRTAANGV
jgi:hypothetical protein